MYLHDLKGYGTGPIQETSSNESWIVNSKSKCRTTMQHGSQISPNMSTNSSTCMCMCMHARTHAGISTRLHELCKVAWFFPFCIWSPWANATEASGLPPQHDIHQCFYHLISLSFRWTVGIRWSPNQCMRPSTDTKATEPQQVGLQIYNVELY